MSNKRYFSENPDEEKSKEILGGFEADEKNEALSQSPETLRNKELVEDDAASTVLRQELEKMDADDGLKLQAQSQANDIKTLNDQKKIETLLKLAKSKGVIYAISVAKKMNDPYVLDKLHDMLVEKGYYKKFLK